MIRPPLCYFLLDFLRLGANIIEHTKRRGLNGNIALHGEQPAFADAPVEDCKDTDEQVVALQAFIDALVVKFGKCFVKTPLVECALPQCSIVNIFVFPKRGKCIVIRPAQYLLSVAEDGGAALPVVAFPVRSTKIFKSPPQELPQKLVLQ